MNKTKIHLQMKHAFYFIATWTTNRFLVLSANGGHGTRDTASLINNDDLFPGTTKSIWIYPVYINNCITTITSTTRWYRSKYQSPYGESRLAVERLLIKAVLSQTGSDVSQCSDVIGQFLNVTDLTFQIILVQKMGELQRERLFIIILLIKLRFVKQAMTTN